MTNSRQVPVFAEPINATVRPPGSKSDTIRALATAALADGRSHLYMPLDADDPTAMVGALRALGVDVATETGLLSVDGRGGRLTPSERPLDANESGLTARILLAVTGSLDGVSRIVGRGRLPERPMKGIVDVLQAQDVEVDGDHLPIEVIGRGHLWGGRIEVDCSDSSQFATAVMLVAPIMHEPSVIELKGLTGSQGYLDMTEAMMRRFGAGIERTVTGYEIANSGYAAADVVIEADASAAAYPMAIAAITGGRVVIDGLGETSRQPDLRVASVLEEMGCRVGWEKTRVSVDASDVFLTGVEVDMAGAPDGALALAVVCLFAAGPSRITGLGSLQHKESDRLTAISQEMRRIGGDVKVDGESLIIRPGDLHGAEVDSHGDHRIAMAMAAAGTRVRELRVSQPAVVNKTWPEYWDLLDAFAST